uniref:X-box-binding protein 1 n=1 Tax=Scophthalmus maximus TaxID=52904 RepID=A0A8D2ZHT7_SCOMX
MITRRRGRAVNNKESLEVEVVDAVETVEDLPSPSEGFSADDIETGGVELDDLFGIEDLKWTLGRETVSPLFDMEFADLGMYFNHMINKNAIAARLNRLKKKEYVNTLEKKVGGLSTENNMLKQENSQLTKRVEELEDETRYLRAVLANESMLSQLLSRLSGVNGMKLSSSLFQGPNSNDHDYALPRKRVKVEEKETSGGICLHVDKNHVSVEFCTKCAESASTSLKM